MLVTAWLRAEAIAVPIAVTYPGGGRRVPKVQILKIMVSITNAPVSVRGSYVRFHHRVPSLLDNMIF